MPDQSPTRRQARSVTLRAGSRPWRVVPLALFAVFAATATMGVAKNLFWNASHHHYADDILRKDLSHIHLR